ncbi:MAG TPA: hypothetical protein DCQ33_04040 [Nitrospira sp.]|nr:hypothetical protein [Nitrospira sp.]
MIRPLTFDLRVHHWPVQFFTIVTLATPDGYCFVGVSVCAPDDQWSRSKGRTVAAQRAIASALGEAGPLQCCTASTLVIDTLREMRKPGQYPCTVLGMRTGIDVLRYPGSCSMPNPDDDLTTDHYTYKVPNT